MFSSLLLKKWGLYSLVSFILFLLGSFLFSYVLSFTTGKTYWLAWADLHDKFLLPIFQMTVPLIVISHYASLLISGNGTSFYSKLPVWVHHAIYVLFIMTYGSVVSQLFLGGCIWFAPVHGIAYALQYRHGVQIIPEPTLTILYAITFVFSSLVMYYWFIKYILKK
jgi:hypothetical protein